MRRPSIVAIVGPTAVGKSAAADGVARAIGAEIVSADSMQIYRGMDIGTAKTPPSERGVPYHCIDVADPGTPYSAALFQRDARIVLDRLQGAGRPAVLVGGTGLYVRAALDEMTFPPGEVAASVRSELERRAAVEGPQTLYDELRRLDRASAALVHPNNTRRVIRALEMLSEGTSYAEHAAGFARRTFHYPDTLLIGLTLERSELYARADARVESMIAGGLMREVEHLLDAGLVEALTAAQAIGYKELVPVLREGADLASAVEDIKRSTRRYAKRQLTWFRADARIHWLDTTGLDTDATVRRALDLVESSEHSA